MYAANELNDFKLKYKHYIKKNTQRTWKWKSEWEKNELKIEEEKWSEK